MPELPDIEVYRRNLVNRIAGKRVVDAWVNREKRTPGESDLRKAVVGATLTTIERDGKAMRFVFDNGNVLAVHLMLNGEFYISDTEEKLGARRITLLLDGVGYFAISDFMGLATVKLNDPPSKVYDALDKKFDVDVLKKAFKRYSGKDIKAVLMDQKVVQGIGNKYSDEVLWLSGIAPQSEAGKVPDEKVEKLFHSIKELLPKATETIYKAFPGAINGKMKEGLKIYRKETTPSGNPVVTLKVGGRDAHYSPDEQTLYS